MPKPNFLPLIRAELPKTPIDLAEYMGMPLGLCTQKIEARPGKSPFTLASWRGFVCNRDLPLRAERINLHVNDHGIVVALEWG